MLERFNPKKRQAKREAAAKATFEAHLKANLEIFYDWLNTSELCHLEGGQRYLLRNMRLIAVIHCSHHTVFPAHTPLIFSSKRDALRFNEKNLFLSRNLVVLLQAPDDRHFVASPSLRHEGTDRNQLAIEVPYTVIPYDQVYSRCNQHLMPFDMSTLIAEVQEDEALYTHLYGPLTDVIGSPSILEQQLGQDTDKAWLRETLAHLSHLDKQTALTSLSQLTQAVQSRID